jgi:hypothetical protein
VPANDQVIGKPRKRHRTATPHNADTGDTSRSRPAPSQTPQKASRVAPFTRPAVEKPFQQQQAQARIRTRAARQRLPAPRIAAPPIIQHPTASQVHAAHVQIVASVRRELGNTTGAARQQRTQEILDRIHTDPRLAHVRESLQHWQAEQAKLTRPQTRARLTAGPAPHRVGVGVGPLHLATVNTTAVGQAAARLGANVAPGLQVPDAPGAFVKNAFGDLGTIAKGPFVAGAQLAGIGKDVVTGHPVRAADRAGELGKAIVEGTVHDFSHPGRYLREHPLLFGLDVTGAGAVVGRTAGALGRLGKLERASTVRPPLALGEDLAAGVVERKGSKDLIRRELQRAADARLEPLRDADGNIVTVEQGGRHVPVLKPRETVRSAVLHPKVNARGALANKRGDVLASRANARERHDRDVESRARRVTGRGQVARDAVSLVARGVITSGPHMRADLTNYARRLRANLSQHEKEVARNKAEIAAGRTPTFKMIYQHEGEVEAARKNLALAEEVLASPKVMAQADRIVAEGTRHGGALVAHDKAAADAGLFEGGHEQARRARLVETAVEHLGAQHGRDPRLTARAQQARRIERGLQAALNFGHHSKENPDLATITRAAEAPPPVAAGHVRLYRGQGVTRFSGEEWDDAPLDAPATQGRWFTDKPERAKGYADGGMGLEGFVSYVDVPEGVARAAHHSDTKNGRTFVLPPKWARRQHELEPGSIDRSRAAHAKREKGSNEAEEIRRRRATARAAVTGQPAPKFPPLPQKVSHRDRVQAQIATVQRIRAQIEARNTERLRDAHGNPLEPHEIEAFLKSRGRDPGTVAYLPPNVTRRQFHKQFRPEQGRGTLTTPGHVRTGAQARKGAVENSAKLIQAAGVRHAVTLAKARSIDRLIAEHGMIHPAAAKAKAGKPLTKHEQRVAARGGYFTGAEAAEVINRAKNAGEYLKAVRAVPGRLDAATQKIIREDFQGPGGMDTLGQRLLNDRVLTEDQLRSAGKTRNVVLVNGHLIDRLNAHLTPSSSAAKFAQITNKAFRYAVLPQPRWLVGNFFEPLVVRMPGVGSGVNVFGLAVDVRAANRLIGHMERHSDPAVRAAAAEIRAHQFGGLLFGNRGLTNRRTLEDFPALHGQAEKVYGTMVAKLPATRQLAQVTGMLLKGGGKGLMAPLHAIFAVNRAGEAGLQRAAFGKAVRRDAEEFTRSWAKTLNLGQKALDDVAKGLTNTATQHRFMDAQHELLGKYEGFSPTLRGIIQGPAPFLPWALNAARFVFWTMPAHRSAQTALLVRLDRVVQNDWEQLHKGVPPGMGLAIPNGKGGWTDVARYTPYGLTGPLAEGELKSVTGQLLPQISGTEAALEGKDPFGRDLVMSTHEKPTGGQKGKIAFNSLLEALVPYLSNARRLQEHGETAFADSTVLHPRTKPGTSHGMSAARRVLDPFRPTYLTAGASREGTPIPPAASQASGPVSPREAFLERRAARLAQQSHQSSEREAFLERRAARLARGG